ncbi:uncharacterized protein C5L36_0C01400 [Pichia kudriavzevii]|uniref:Uncharacterized protein n=1 Tax=Pichia kudriavzevii TaxID=4909 RepID=A0A2U9R4B5_PICKU|nr:uncharacterized protein C5L36_0C01400 [Pichia kudriavzevii]AWU76192.1 hypothetical protein C5L36_0C01400 [Pichia kudriavzevii]
MHTPFTTVPTTILSVLVSVPQRHSNLVPIVEQNLSCFLHPCYSLLQRRPLLTVNVRELTHVHIEPRQRLHLKVPQQQLVQSLQHRQRVPATTGTRNMHTTDTFFPMVAQVALLNVNVNKNIVSRYRYALQLREGRQRVSLRYPNNPLSTYLSRPCREHVNDLRHCSSVHSQRWLHGGRTHQLLSLSNENLTS